VKLLINALVFVTFACLMMLTGFCVGIASAQSPEEFPNSRQVAIENADSVEKIGILPVTINAFAMVLAGELDAEGRNVLCTEGLLTIVDCMPTNIASTTARWWIDVDNLQPSTSQTYTVYSGNTTDSPRTDSGAMLNPHNSSRITVPHNTNFNDIDELFVTTQFDTQTCGTVASKSRVLSSGGIVTAQEGWNLSIAGINDSATGTTGNNITLASTLAYQITPNEDIWLCGVSAPYNHSPLNPISVATITIRIEAGTSDPVVSQFNSTTMGESHNEFLNFRPTISGTSVEFIQLPIPVFLEFGESYYVVYTLDTSIRRAGALLDVVGTYATYHTTTNITVNGVSTAGLGIFNSSAHRLGAWIVPATGIDADNPVEMVGRIEETYFRYTLYNGTRANWLVSYEDPDLVLYENTVNFDGIRAVESVGVPLENTTSNIKVGWGLTGNYALFVLSDFADINPALEELNMTAESITITQVGSGANGFTWLYNVNNGFILGVDGELQFIADTTGVNVTVGDVQPNVLANLIPADEPDWLTRYFESVGATDDESGILMALIAAIAVIVVLGMLRAPLMGIAGVLAVGVLGATMAGVLPIYMFVAAPVLLVLGFVIKRLLSNGDTE